MKDKKRTIEQDNTTHSDLDIKKQKVDIIDLFKRILEKQDMTSLKEFMSEYVVDLFKRILEKRDMKSLKELLSIEPDIFVDYSLTWQSYQSRDYIPILVLIPTIEDQVLAFKLFQQILFYFDLPSIDRLAKLMNRSEAPAFPALLLPGNVGKREEFFGMVAEYGTKMREKQKVVPPLLPSFSFLNQQRIPQQRNVNNNSNPCRPRPSK